MTPLISAFGFRDELPAEIDGSDPHERPLPAVADQPMRLPAAQHARLNLQNDISSEVGTRSGSRLEEGKAKRDLWRTERMR